MPLPFILGAAAAAAAAFGVKKGYDAYSDNKRANELLERAERYYERAKDELEEARSEATATLEHLGAKKLEVWDRQMGRFVSLFEQLRRVEASAPNMQDLNIPSFTPAELGRMRNVALKASEVVAGGVGALGAGALVGVASYGGAMMLATASTGTAISTLGGVAATNATLAWFGGGSLAAGGLGVAGGTAVLGGLIAGPVLAVGGALMAAKAAENLAEARKVKAESDRAVAQMESAATMLRAIEAVADQFSDAIADLSRRLSPVLDELERIITEARTRASWWEKLWARIGRREPRADYRRLSPHEQQMVHLSVQLAQVTKLLLETPILTQDGSLDERSQGVVERLTEGQA